jgi:sarcosine oxidase subunit alpha
VAAPLVLPKPGEDLHAAVNRECLATRNSVGVMDASTLGKIDVKGPDAREFLNRIYSNAWSKLDPGKCRYGLMLDENGMVMDDGVTACLADDHFHMTTTTGGAARVYSWLERWHQTEWPELKVRFTTTTDHWATVAVAEPAGAAKAVHGHRLRQGRFQVHGWPQRHRGRAAGTGVPHQLLR